MKVGYCRVSSKEQNLERQTVLMEEAGVERVYSEKQSGKDRERPELKAMLGFVREGDEVHIESLSRLGRNTRDLLYIVEQLESKGVKLVSHKESLDTSTPAGRFVLTMFAAISEMERDYILERQREGIAIAKAAGRYKGRKRIDIKDFDRIYKDVLSGNLTVTKACKLLGVSYQTFRRRLKEKEGVTT